MKKNILFVLMNMIMAGAMAQPLDSAIKSRITITKDERIDLLGKKMTEYNESLATKIRLEKGYRLMLLSTTDRAQALQLRSRLLQQYPDQNVYMTFQSPYIKLKFGDFIEKEEAEEIRKELMSLRLITGNIYLVPEMVEVRPDKVKLTPVEEN